MDLFFIHLGSKQKANYAKDFITKHFITYIYTYL